MTRDEYLVSRLRGWGLQAIQYEDSGDWSVGIPSHTGIAVAPKDWEDGELVDWEAAPWDLSARPVYYRFENGQEVERRYRWTLEHLDTGAEFICPFHVDSSVVALWVWYKIDQWERSQREAEEESQA